MSLFRTKDFWETYCDEEEYFDQNSLAVSNLCGKSDFIITGSHSGVLRIFKPFAKITENTLKQGFRPGDLVIETVLDSPVLQVNCGKLISGSSSTQIAVLQPRILSVFSLIIKEGQTEHGVQNTLKLMYEHKLRRSAYDFTIGPFGGIKNRDFICVQSLDGMLTFFEQESFSFSCFLGNFLLPGPLVYFPKTDSFITNTSSWCIESFRYNHLYESGQNSTEEDNSGKKVKSNWSFNVSEAVLDIQCLCVNKTENFILILGERNLFCLSEVGKIKFMKRFDFSPICFTTYTFNDNIMTMVVAETNTLLIYKGTVLKWSAKLNFLPISIKRADLDDIKGGIVIMSETGRINCCYLGTEPSLFVAPPLSCQELDYQKVETDLANYNKVIQMSYSNEKAISGGKEELILNVKVNTKLERCSIKTNLPNTINNQMGILKIDVIPKVLFEEVQISISVQKPIKVFPQIEFYSNITEKTSLNCLIFLDQVSECPSLNVDVVASFITNMGVPKAITKSVMLPLSLVLEICQPQKESLHKITLQINESPIPLNLLFYELIGENDLSTLSSNAAAFKNITEKGKIVTILLAKSSDRYRIQSDSLASLNLVIEQMVHHLQNHFIDKTGFRITFNSAIPTNEAFGFINAHFVSRQEHCCLYNEISQLSSQFRLIEKRLISKLKVKNPTPLTNLEILLQDTFTEIIKASDKYKENLSQLEISEIELSCVISLINNLFPLMGLNEENLPVILSAFSPVVYDMEGQGWEDVMESSLCFLLRTILAKSEKDKLRVAQTSFDEVIDINKLEKHFMQVLERISKRNISEMPIVEEEKCELVEHISVGNKIGESSLRLLSAKPRNQKQEPADGNKNTINETS